jgi:hypothetical protein
VSEGNGPGRIIGVDLGQQRDYTAISVTERVLLPTGKHTREPYNDWDTQRVRWRSVEEAKAEYHVRHLERPALGTRYTKIVDRILEVVKALDGKLALVVDATGVGLSVTDMLWDRLHEEVRRTASLNVRHANITITGGDTVTRVPGGYRVPKRDLISAPLVLMQNGQLKIAEGLQRKDTLVKELLNFRVKINISTAHDSYEAWREGDHDDLVLSVALACWAGERFWAKPKLAKVHIFQPPSD